MSFGNPIAGSTGELIRNALRSRNYVPGISGWKIDRDGDVEFNNALVRGSLRVSSPTGSEIVINADPTVAYMSLEPGSIPGHTFIPGVIYTDAIDFAPPVVTSLWLKSPAVLGGSAAYASIALTADEGDETGIQYSATFHDFSTDILGVFPTIRLAGDTLGFETEADNQLSAASSVGTRNVNTFAAIPGAPTGSIVKRYANTRLRIEMHVSAYVDTIACFPEFALQIGTTDYTLAGYPVSQANVRQPFAGVDMLTGIPAGTYNITPRWRRAGGGGLVGRVAGSETCSWSVSEVKEA